MHAAAPGLDLDKLARAVAVAETSGCTQGSGRSRNNCFGIMHWPGGKRTLISYPSKEASFEHFKDIWSRLYKRFPDRALAAKWTGNDHPDRWLATVEHVYYSL